MLFNCISHHWPVVKDKRLLRVSSESWQLILGVVLCTVAIVNLAYSGIFCRLDWEQESVQEVESLWTLQECSGNIILLGGGRYRGMCFSLEWVSLKLWAHDSVVFPASFQWYIHAGHQRFPDTKEEVSNSLKRWHSLDKLWKKKKSLQLLLLPKSAYPSRQIFFHLHDMSTVGSWHRCFTDL